MSEENKISWPGWETGKLLGRGSFGADLIQNRRKKGCVKGHKNLLVCGLQSYPHGIKIRFDCKGLCFPPPYLSDKLPAAEIPEAVLTEAEGQKSNPPNQ
jgi:hypothetical protein